MTILSRLLQFNRLTKVEIDCFKNGISYIAHRRRKRGSVHRLASVGADFSIRRRVAPSNHFTVSIRRRRRVPKLIGSGGKLVKGIDGGGKMSLQETPASGVC